MTNLEMQKRIEELEEQLRDVMEWIQKKNQQQIQLPIDKASKDIIIQAVTNP